MRESHALSLAQGDARERRVERSVELTLYSKAAEQEVDSTAEGF